MRSRWRRMWRRKRRGRRRRRRGGGGGGGGGGGKEKAIYLRNGKICVVQSYVFMRIFMKSPN